MKEHLDFYETITKIKGWALEPEGYWDTIPSEEVERLYEEYNKLPLGNPRLLFRRLHPDLDAWLVAAKGNTPVWKIGITKPPSMVYTGS